MKKTLINVKKRLIESLFFALRFIHKTAGLICFSLWLIILFFPNYPCLLLFSLLLGYICGGYKYLLKTQQKPTRILEITPESPLCTTKESFHESNLIYYKTQSGGYNIVKNRYGKIGPCTEEQLQLEIKLNQ